LDVADDPTVRCGGVEEQQQVDGAAVGELLAGLGGCSGDVNELGCGSWCRAPGAEIRDVELVDEIFAGHGSELGAPLVGVGVEPAVDELGGGGDRGGLGVWVVFPVGLLAAVDVWRDDRVGSFFVCAFPVSMVVDVVFLWGLGGVLPCGARGGVGIGGGLGGWFSA
jgi:hypothetical protein